MRILQVITDTDRRGAQVFAADLAEPLRALSHDVETVALAEGDQQRRLDVPVLGPRRRSPSTLRSLRARMADVDITIAHGSATALACAVAGGRRRPWVYRQISDTRFWARTRVRRARVQRYLRRARVIVALSDGAKRDLVDHLGLNAGLIRVVPNGVPVRGFHPATHEERTQARSSLGLDGESTVALFIGALVGEKGADTAITAIGNTSKVQLLVVGGGPEFDALAEMGLSVPDRVHMVGVLDDPLPAYFAADVVLLPSRGGDSMPATLIEAAFCALPSIATPIGSIEDLVLDGETGFIVEPDDPVSLARAIERIASEESLGEQLGRAALDHCTERFEIHAVARGWDTVLREALK